MKTTHRLNLLAAALAGMMTLATAVAHASEIGHYGGGLFNIRDFFVPPPGLYGAVYNYWYSTDRINNSHGNKINSVTINPPGGGAGVTASVDVNVDMYVVAPMLMWTTDINPLGIRYGAAIAPSFANANLDAALSAAGGRGGSVENGSFGVGDLFVQPVWLGKSLPHWDFALAYGFYAPIGKYDTGTVTVQGIGPVKTESIDNIGYGFWTHQFQGSIAWYPMTNRATAVVAALTYEKNGEKEDFDLTPGDNLTLNWGISQFLPLKKDMTLLLEVGPAGYDTWQITEDSGSDASNTRDQVHGVGGQLGIIYTPWMLSVTAHGYYEFYAEDRFQGQSFGISIARKF